MSALACVLILVRGRFKQHALLWSYLALLAATNCAGFAVLALDGFASLKYFLFYSYAGFLLTIAMCGAMLELYLHMFPERPARRRIVGLGFLAAAIVTTISAVIALSGFPASARLIVIEVSQNLTVAAMLAVFGLFRPSLWNRRVPMHVYQIIVVIGVYAALLTGNFLTHRLYPRQNRSFEDVSMAFASLWLPFGIAYIFSNPATDRRRPQIHC